MKEYLAQNNIQFSVLCVGIVFFSNFIVPSGTNGFPHQLNFSLERAWENKTAGRLFKERSQDHEFQRRPFVLEFQKFSAEKLSIPKQFSFNILNYGCLFFFFLLIPSLSSALNNRFPNPNYIRFFLAFSFPLLFAFYPTIYSYDDIVQYLLLSIFIILLLKDYVIGASMILSLAIICRETSLLYLLLFVFYFWQNRQYNVSFTLFCLVSPVLVYIFFLSNYLEPELMVETKNFLIDKRFFAWKNNLSPFYRLQESSSIIFIVLAFPFFWLLKSLDDKEYDPEKRKWLYFAIFFTVLNTVIVSVSGLLREARLLFLPYLLVIPLVSTEVRNSFLLLANSWKKMPAYHFFLILIISILFAFGWFKTTSPRIGYFFKVYGFLYTVLFLMNVYLFHRKPVEAASS